MLSSCEPTAVLRFRSLHDALPICPVSGEEQSRVVGRGQADRLLRAGLRGGVERLAPPHPVLVTVGDRKSTRLNSSHVALSYAVYYLKKKKHTHQLWIVSANVPSTR